MDYLKKYQVLKHVIITTVVHLVAPILIIWIYPLFSHEHVLQPEQLSLKYDEILYFHNNYEYQPNHAFMFGYIYLVKFSKILFSHFGNFWAMIFLLVINKLAYLSAAGDLYVILQKLAISSNYNKDSEQKEQKDTNQAQKIAYYGLLFFIYNPAGIFFNSIYTEAIFSFLTFKSIKYLLTYQQFTHHQFISKESVVGNFLKSYPLFLPIFLLFLACCIKSNSILLSAVIGLELVSGIFTIKQIKNWIMNVLKGFTILILLLSPNLIHSFFTYYNLCLVSQIKGDLCKNNIFGIYGAVQEKHWGVGFLNHYTQKNILFIILGAPAIIFGGIGLFFFTKKFNLRQFGLYLSFLFIWITTTFFANIQPSTRFFCAHPFFYFILAKIGTKTFLVRFWGMAYWIVGIFLFTVRMPWV